MGDKSPKWDYPSSNPLITLLTKSHAPLIRVWGFGAEVGPEAMEKGFGFHATAPLQGCIIYL